MNRIPEAWAPNPTQDELNVWSDVEFKWAKHELAYRLNEHYIADGYTVEMTEDEFDELAHDMDEQMDWQGCEYIGDWLREVLEERGYVKEEA